jgi:type-F conjugative transfer system pilin assembly thiol-disulfide isomerase TrbB
MSLTAFAMDFTDNHHLLFLFSSHCPHCHNQAPILKAFAKERHFSVESYSLDNQGLPDFPDAQIPPDDLLMTAFSGQSIQTPAIFLVNSETLALYPVAIGEVGFEELYERVQDLSSKVIRFENGGAS